jgi:hypothetical protein
MIFVLRILLHFGSNEDWGYIFLSILHKNKDKKQFIHLRMYVHQMDYLIHIDEMHPDEEDWCLLKLGE